MENFDTALLLMVVGMATVFAILLAIIFLGKFLILLVNKYAPEEVVAVKKTSPPNAIPPHILAAITSAVKVVTQGKGKITKIDKI